MTVRKKSREWQTLPPVDVAQRYTIAETIAYLLISHASVYKEINAGRIKVLKQGKRTFVPGTEVARLSRINVQILRRPPQTRSRLPRGGRWTITTVRFREL